MWRKILIVHTSTMSSGSVSFMYTTATGKFVRIRIYKVVISYIYMIYQNPYLQRSTVMLCIWIITSWYWHSLQLVVGVSQLSRVWNITKIPVFVSYTLWGYAIVWNLFTGFTLEGNGFSLRTVHFDITVSSVTVEQVMLYFSYSHHHCPWCIQWAGCHSLVPSLHPALGCIQGM